MNSACSLCGEHLHHLVMAIHAFQPNSSPFSLRIPKPIALVPKRLGVVHRLPGDMLANMCWFAMHSVTYKEYESPN